MKKYQLLLLMVGLILTLGVAGVQVQTAGGYDLSWWTVDGGGGTVSGGGYTLSGTVGQPDAGDALTGGGYTLAGGFWVGGGSSGTKNHKLYTPLILK